MEALFTGENVEIICRAVGGNPDVHNLTLTKSDTNLKLITQSNSLSHSTRDMYGVYTCVVESLHTTATESILLQEKGTVKHEK